MLTVNTYLAPSPVHGIGLFAAESIPAGTVVWKFNRHTDKTFSKKVFLAMCQSVDQCSLRHLLNSSYKRSGRYFYLTDNARFINHKENNRYHLCIDNAQFMNHSDSGYNVVNTPHNTMLAPRCAIRRGEELLCNSFQYSDADAVHVERLAG